MSGLISALAHSDSPTAKVLGSLKESFSHTDVRKALSEGAFKKGDRVRVVGHPEEEGKVGTISKLLSNGWYLVTTGYDMQGHPLDIQMHPSYLKRVVNESKYGGANGFINRLKESSHKHTLFGSLHESRSLKEGSGNIWVHGKEFYDSLLSGVKKVFPKAHVNKKDAKEIVVPAKKAENDAGLHLEAWSDYVYVVADCANPAINSETIAKKRLPESEYDPKDDLYFLRPLKKEDWVTLGENAAKVLKAKYSVNESVKGSGKKTLRESWQDAKVPSPEEAVAELADGLKSLDYDATASGRDVLVKFEDLELRLHCAFQSRDCMGQEGDPKVAGSFVVYWDPENGVDPIQEGIIVGWFDWKTAVKGAYVINGQKLAIHLGRDGGAATIRERIRASSELAKEAIQNGETAMVNGETFLI